MNYKIVLVLVLATSFLGVSSFIIRADAYALPACSDGVDNDGDGLVDATYDLGCSGPQDGSETAAPRSQKNGWTTFDKSSDTQVFYVSSSIGNDNWTGLCPEVPTSGNCGPFRTVAQGRNAVRHGYPDWLLFRRGDTWNTGFETWGKSGRSSTERMVIGSYGASTQRPIFKFGAGNAFRVTGQNNLAVIGLDFYGNTRDPNSPDYVSPEGSEAGGLYFMYSNQNILLEDNRVRYGGGITFSSSNATGGPNAGCWSNIANVEARRNIIDHSYASIAHSQGLYTHSGDNTPSVCPGSPERGGYVLIEDNFLYLNGWNNEFPVHKWMAWPNDNMTIWRTVTNGQFKIKLDCDSSGNCPYYNITQLNFSSASSMTDIATILQNAINNQTGRNITISVWTSANGRPHLIFNSPNPTAPYPNANVGMIGVSSTGTGTDISGSNYLRGPGGKVYADIFNRNMYLSHGWGNTDVLNNITAEGASGGIQLRAGGRAINNLMLKEPLALSFGHTENPGGFPVGGVISNNVVLGSNDINGDPRGYGLGFGSLNYVNDGFHSGPSLIQNAVMSHNIVAHNQLGTANINGLQLNGNGPMSNVEVFNNIVYDWSRPNWPYPLQDTRACALSLGISSASTNVRIHDNSFQQPNLGFAGCASSSSVAASLVNNSYFSTSPTTPPDWRVGWFQMNDGSVTNAQWLSQMGDVNPNLQQQTYPDPNRSIESYMASLNMTPSYQAFINEMLGQSRFNWRSQFTAPVVNEYIRQGFGLASATCGNGNIDAGEMCDDGLQNGQSGHCNNTCTGSTTPTIQPPSITTQLNSATVTVGQPVNFSVVAAGTAPLVYQWKKNGVVIPTATNPSYLISATVLSDAGNYTVVVSNAAGTVTSNPAVLTVNPVVPIYTLNLYAEHGNILKSPNQSSYTAGQQVTLTPVAQTGYEFIGWGGDFAGVDEPLVMTVNSNALIIASFQPVPVDNIAPSMVSRLLSSRPSNGTLTFKWYAATDNVGVVAYIVDLSTSSSFSNYLPGWQARNMGNILTATIPNLNPGTRYYFRVKAVDAAGNQGPVRIISNTA